MYTYTMLTKSSNNCKNLFWGQTIGYYCKIWKALSLITDSFTSILQNKVLCNIQLGTYYHVGSYSPNGKTSSTCPGKSKKETKYEQKFGSIEKVTLVSFL